MNWKPCRSFPKYEVSEDGRVRHVSSGRVRSLSLDPNGYVRYGLFEGGKQIYVKASRLVLEAFVGPPPFDKAEACHNDGSRTNDRYTNLRWDTQKGNAADRKVHGTETLGEKHGQSKLKDGDIREIRRLKLSGRSQNSISFEFNVTKSVISDIINRKAWVHVS